MKITHKTVINTKRVNILAYDSIKLFMRKVVLALHNSMSTV